MRSSLYFLFMCGQKLKKEGLNKRRWLILKTKNLVKFEWSSDASIRHY